MNKTIIYLISGFLLLALLALGFAYLRLKETQIKIQAEKDKTQQETQAKEQAERKKIRDIEACTNEARSSYRLHWVSNCKNHGFNIEYEDTKAYSVFKGAFVSQKEISTCSLPSYIADSLNDTLQKEEDRCLEKYKE